MSNKYKYGILAAAAVMTVSCSKAVSIQPDEFNLRLEQPHVTKVTLQNPLSLYAAERLWAWEEGDMPSVIYSKNGSEIIVPVVSCSIDQEDPSMMKVSAGDTPSGASLVGTSFGSKDAYGRSCRGDKDIPSSMVYARATFSSIGEATVLPDLTMRHQCSYMLIVPDSVADARMTSFTIEGKGLKGGDGIQSVRLSFKDSQSGTYEPRWVAVCNKATDVTVTVTAGNETFEMASFADVGKGKCNLYYVRNTSIGVGY